MSIASEDANIAGWTKHTATVLDDWETNGLPQQTSGTAVVTSVNDTASSTTLKAANTAAHERIIQNDSPSTLYVKFGTTASTTDYTVKLGQDDILITQYTGRIDGIWSADASGAAKITELT
jgi:hypothetical protein